MKTERNILIAFILNLAFSIFEFIGGAVVGSVAIISDAVHDIGDAASIGISYFLERKSKKQPDKTHTYGYMRYSVIGGVITTVILLLGSAAVIYNAILRIMSPVEINYDGMIIFAIVGAAVNLLAAFFTREGDSINQKAVNLHMLEDVLGWVLVLVGAVVMRFTDISIIDPLMSIGVAVFILINAVKNLKEVVSVKIIHRGQISAPLQGKLNYNAWGSIFTLDGGEMISVWSGDRYAHICPFGRVLAARSTDGGYTWTPPYAVQNTPLDDRDAGIVSLKNQIVMATALPLPPKTLLETVSECPSAIPSSRTSFPRATPSCSPPSTTPAHSRPFMPTTANIPPTSAPLLTAISAL